MQYKNPLPYATIEGERFCYTNTFIFPIISFFFFFLSFFFFLNPLVQNAETQAWGMGVLHGNL